MNKQDGQEYLAQQEAKADIADQLYELMDGHKDKWGLTYDKQVTQTVGERVKPQVARAGSD